MTDDDSQQQGLQRGRRHAAAVAIPGHERGELQGSLASAMGLFRVPSFAVLHSAGRRREAVARGTIGLTQTASTSQEQQATGSKWYATCYRTEGLALSSKERRRRATVELASLLRCVKHPMAREDR